MVNYTVLPVMVICQHILMPAANSSGKNIVASVAFFFSLDSRVDKLHKIKKILINIWALTFQELGANRSSVYHLKINGFY